MIFFRKNYQKYFAFVICFLVIGLTSATVAAQANQSNAISKGFSSKDSEIVQGAIVSTAENDSKSVELASVNNVDRIAGVASQTSLVELSSGTNETQVILSGTTTVLVSDINGPIKSGAKITASPISGVGMVASEDAQIIGTAQGDFKTDGASTKTIQDKQGKSQTVHIGYIPLQINISYYAAPTSQFVPQFIQNLADSIAGRPVSFIRILLSFLLLLLAFGSIFVLIYTSVRSGIISLGRNPLAANAIQRSLLGIVIVILLIATVSMAGIFIILKA